MLSFGLRNPQTYHPVFSSASPRTKLCHNIATEVEVSLSSCGLMVENVKKVSCRTWETARRAGGLSPTWLPIKGGLKQM